MTEKVKLNEITDIYLGVTHTPEYVLDGVPFLSVKDISGGKICFDECKFISQKEYNSLSEGAKPKVGDMLFCRVGTIGKPIIIPEGTPLFGSFVSLGYLRNKAKDRCNLNYLRYWMYSNSFWKQVNKNVKGASQVNLNTGWLSNFEIRLPDFSEQTYIVSILDKCKLIIERREEELKKFDNLIRARFFELFVNTDHIYEKEPLNNNIKEMFIGPFGSAVKNEVFVDKEKSFCMVYEQKHAIQKTLDLPTRYIDRKKFDELKRFTVMGGDIIVSCRGTVGEIYSVPDDAPIGIMHPSIMKIRLKPEKYCNLFFVVMLNQFMKENVEKSNGSGIKMAITAKDLGNELFFIPPLKEQMKFEQFVHQVNKSKLLSVSQPQIHIYKTLTLL